MESNYACIVGISLCEKIGYVFDSDYCYELIMTLDVDFKHSLD